MRLIPQPNRYYLRSSSLNNVLNSHTQLDASFNLICEPAGPSHGLPADIKDSDGISEIPNNHVKSRVSLDSSTGTHCL